MFWGRSVGLEHLVRGGGRTFVGLGLAGGTDLWGLWLLAEGASVGLELL